MSRYKVGYIGTGNAGIYKITLSMPMQAAKDHARAEMKQGLRVVVFPAEWSMEKARAMFSANAKANPSKRKVAAPKSRAARMNKLRAGVAKAAAGSAYNKAKRRPRKLQYIARGASLAASNQFKKLAKKLHLNPAHKAGSADKVAARELVIFISSDPTMSARYALLARALEKKHKAGIYSATKAAKLFVPFVTEGAKKYAKAYSDPAEWNYIFAAATRRLAARALASSHGVEMRAGNYHV